MPTKDITLPRPAGAAPDPRLSDPAVLRTQTRTTPAPVDAPLMTYDKRRASRELTRPIRSKR